MAVKTIDVTGKTEDEAVSRALAQLGLERDAVSVEILERAKSGFLGIGARPAKVRITYGLEEVVAPKPPVQPVKPVKVEKPVEKMPEKSEDAPKKKIVRVLRPQNTQKGARPGAKRQAGKPLNSQVRQVQANNGRPSKAAPVQRAETAVKPQEHARPTAERPAAERPAAANPAAVRPAEEKPAVKKAEPAVWCSLVCRFRDIAGVVILPRRLPRACCGKRSVRLRRPRASRGVC